MPFASQSPHTALATLGVLCIAACAAGCGSPSAATSHPKVPLGFVDAPQPNQELKGNFNAMGWAASEDRIARVSVYVDRVYLKDCTLGGSRPDVSKLYVGFPEGDNSGWGVGLDAAALPEGKHELLFEAASSKGAIRDLGAIPVIIVH